MKNETMGTMIATKRKELGMTQLELAEVFFRTICMAMGIAVVVLSIMNQIETRTAIMLLGIGLTCGGISLFEKK